FTRFLNASLFLSEMKSSGFASIRGFLRFGTWCGGYASSNERYCAIAGEFGHGGHQPPAARADARPLPLPPTGGLASLVYAGIRRSLAASTAPYVKITSAPAR